MTCWSVGLKIWRGCLQIKMKTNHVSAESDPVPLYLPNVLLAMHCGKQTSEESGISPDKPQCFLKKKKLRQKRAAFISEIEEKPIWV